MVWTAPGPDREATVAAFFRAFDAVAAEHGWLWVTEGLRAVALWAPPGSEAAFEALTFELRDLRELLREASGRYDSFWGWADALRPAEPHWYLDHVAVDASARGAGLGSRSWSTGSRSRAPTGCPPSCALPEDNVAFYGVGVRDGAGRRAPTEAPTCGSCRTRRPRAVT
jgi:hypothetical protein